MSRFWDMGYRESAEPSMKEAGEIALPLAGRRVLVTRAAHQAGKLSEGLRAIGAEPVEVPVIEIRPPSDLRPLDRALRELSSYDWLILTSANTVQALAERAAALGLDLTAAARFNVAAVGEATATAARQAGLSVALVPENYVAESLVDSLLRQGHDPKESGTIAAESHEVPGHAFSRVNKPDVAPVSRSAVPAASKPPAVSFRGQRFLIARAAVARDVIPHALRAAGATVDVVDAYRNVMPESAPALLREALQLGIDAAAFTSSSSVTHLADAARQAGIAFPFAGVAAISIGPITSKTLSELGWTPAAEASPSDVPGLIEAVKRVLADPPTR
jgi:uroporphyrinogen-III synthase/uroporphyrinogen III methyltransferase/synthase